MEYEQLILSSFKKLRTNLKLFIPDILSSLISLLIVFILAYILGIIPALISNPLALSDKTLLTDAVIEQFGNMGAINFIGILVLGVLLLILVKVYTDTIKYKYLAGLTRAKSAKLDFNFDNKIYSLLYLRLIVILISVVPFVVTLILTGIVIAFSTVLAIILGILAFISALWMASLIFILFFKYPLMFMENLSVWNVIKSSFKLIKKYWKTIFILQVITFLIGITIMIIGSPLYLINLITNPTLFIIFYIPVTMIRTLINMISALVVDIFIFSSYKEL